MKAQKNKIVFILVMVCVVLFITVYAILTFGKGTEEALGPDRIPMPDLEDDQKAYESKMEALEAIKEERTSTPPQIYPDHMVDDKGYFNPDYMEYEKQRIIDSVYRSKTYYHDNVPIDLVEEKAPSSVLEVTAEKDEVTESKDSVYPQAFALEHQLFFASDPAIGNSHVLTHEREFTAYVDGEQTIRDGQRLNMRLAAAVQINGSKVPRGTRIYGFVKLRPNRMLVAIFQLGHQEIELKGYDLQDGQEGIYVENHITGEVVESGLDKTIGEVNLPGMPQLGGIKRIFQRNNRAIKVAISDKYEIVLKQ